MHYIKCAVLFILLAIASCHIYSATPKITYDYDGHPKIYHIFLMIDKGLGANDYLRFLWPTLLHSGTDKTVLQVKLISFSNNLEIVSTVFNSYPANTNPEYFVTFNYALTANTWFEIQIFPNVNPATLIGLLQVEALSDYGSDAIVYDSNLAFAYISVQTASVPSTLGVSVSGTSESTRTASIYSFDIIITPTIASSKGGNFTVQIYYDNAVHLDGSLTSLDFTFMGLCQAAQHLGSTAVINFCQISQDLSTLTFSMSDVTTTAFKINTQISNPLFISHRGIKAYWVDFVSGVVRENGKQPNALSVNPILIDPPTTGRVYLLWGIDKDYYTLTSDTNVQNVPLGLYVASGSNVGPFNSFNIGFYVHETSPINGQYRVYILLRASGILQGSIAHNLPSYAGKQVYCSYDSGTFYLICENVGAFINTADISYRYFISGKAHFPSSLTAITDFAQIKIKPVVYDANGNQLAVQLFTPLNGVTMQVKPSQDYLDSNTNGFHHTSAFKIGNAQVVSYEDHVNNLTSTGDAIKSFLNDGNSTVGIVPDMGVSQQLLFLMKVGAVTNSSETTSKKYYTKLFYNSKVISFDNGAEARGLDFVGYDGTTNWSISDSPCYKTNKVVCEKYNADTPTYNKQYRIGDGQDYNFYGMYDFKCGDFFGDYVNCTSTNCQDQCNMFTGYGTTAGKSSVVAMRDVVFPSGYHNSLYADSGLLDFLIVFIHGSSLAGVSLINGFTMNWNKMQNIKAAYVNYYERTDNVNYNKGIRIPMMIRIGGGVLPTQSLGATAMGVFFDDYVDANTFWQDPGNSYDIGCSTGNCKYYRNTGINIPRNDIWHTNRAVHFFDIPAIKNQFNILVPVTPDTTNHNAPKTLTVAFFAETHSIAQATGLLKTLSVYRLFGSSVSSGVVGAINTINGLYKNGSGPDVNFVNDYIGAGSFSYSINTANINDKPPNNTFNFGSTHNPSIGGYYGAAITITSFYYNIFASSTLSFQTPPANTATTCTIFQYLYNQIQSIGSNTDRNKKYIYTAYCPIDSDMNLNSASGNIKFDNPQYPNVFTKNYPLSQIIAYAQSNPVGALINYIKQGGSISTYTRSCTTSKLNPYNPETSAGGKQRSTFTVTTPSILMSNSGLDGYPFFYIKIDLPGSTVGSSLTMLTPYCQISDALLSCQATAGSSSQTILKITYTVLTGTYTVTYFELGLYATASSTFGSAADYTLTIQLPQRKSGSLVIFGNDNSTATTYASCTSSFTVGITPNGKVMNFDQFNAQTNMRLLKSPISFNFGSNSFRQTFFSTSVYRFNFGFLTDPFSTDYTRSNLRCLIYQINDNQKTISNKWKSLKLSTLNSADLVPKNQFDSPASYLYNLKCFGSRVPSGTNTTSLSLSWVDYIGASQYTIQQATPIAQVSSFLSSPAGTVSVSLPKKSFATQGQKAFYHFQVSCGTNLDENSRLYFDFHFKLLEKLDLQGNVQCYTRNNINDADSTAIFTYCQFVSEYQLVVWNNKIVAPSTSFIIDIYNIQQPKNANIDITKQFITLSVDTDTDYAGGVYGISTVADAQPSASSNTNIPILQTSLNTTYIRSPQTINIIFKPLSNIFSSGTQKLFLLLPPSYAEWITRSQDITSDVTLSPNGTTTNLVSSAIFISKRILKIAVNGDSSPVYSLTIVNLNSPSALPEGKNNQFRLKLFLSDPNHLTVTAFTFTDYSKHLTLIPDQNLIDLSWKQFQITQGDALITLNESIDGSFGIFNGYYSNVLELRQSIYPQNFQTSMTLTLNNNPVANFPTMAPMEIKLGQLNAYFRMAAQSTVQAGLYTLQFTKSGETTSLYTIIPPLTVVVSNTKCSLKTEETAYNIPVGGYTLPIKISCINCIPISDISISVAFNLTGIQLENDLSSVNLNSSRLDGKLYLVVRHNNPALTSGTILMSFTITGTNAASYNTIPPVTLTIVSSTSYQILPSATSLAAPVLRTNTAKFTMQCSMASTIYWGLGIYPSILNSQALDFQARIISSGDGLKTNFTEENDPYYKVYGLNYVPTTQTLVKTLYNLKSNADYIIKYFCVNQLGYSSDSQSVNFTSLNYGAYLMKVSITFRGALTYGQYHDLSCSLAENFKIPYDRIMTEAMSTCSSTSNIFYPSDSSIIANQPDTNGQYLYNFYILPDYSLSTDDTNINVRSSLALHSFTTQIITSTNNFADLPEMVQMQTQDVQVFTDPTFSLSDPLSGLSSVIFTGTVTNMNGFIVVGVIKGVFDQFTMTLPTTTNIKKGKFDTDILLEAVMMQYAPQNFNITITFQGLSPDTTYSAYYFATSDDPVFTSSSTKVQTIEFKTLQVLDININYSNIAWSSTILMIALIMVIS